MKDIANKTDNVEQTFAAAEYNTVTAEVKNLVEDTGQTLTDGSQTIEDTDPFQSSKAVSTYVSRGSYYTSTGSANAYILTAAAPLKSPVAYGAGMKIRFSPNFTNTGASSVNVQSMGVIPIKKNNGAADVEAGDITLNSYTECIYIAAGTPYFKLNHAKTENAYPITDINGFRIAQNSGDINYYTEMFEGSARSADDQVNLTIPVGQSIIKYTNATWADGSGVGGMAAGVSLSPNTTYHCIPLGKDDGTTNWGFDTSVVGANLLATPAVIAAGYKHYRYASSIMTNAGSDTDNYINYISGGASYIVWEAVDGDYTATNPGTSAILATIRVPLGISVIATVNIEWIGTTGSYGWIESPLGGGVAFNNITRNAAAVAVIETNTNSQIRYTIDASSPATQVNIGAVMFFLPR